MRHAIKLLLEEHKIIASEHGKMRDVLGAVLMLPLVPPNGRTSATVRAEMALDACDSEQHDGDPK